MSGWRMDVLTAGLKNPFADLAGLEPLLKTKN
jgi:hypothetical protein